VSGSRAPAGSVDPLDPTNHDKPLWIVCGAYVHEPVLLLAKINRHATCGLTIWGYSVYRRQPGFRTLGLALAKWSERQGYGPFYFDAQAAALAHLAKLTTPKVTS
jgi:hypothetical protein